jgi:hypothetical protein
MFVIYSTHYSDTDKGSRGRSVSIVNGYGLDGRGSISDTGRGFFLLVSASRPALGPNQPPVQWVPVVLSPGQSAAGA